MKYFLKYFFYIYDIRLKIYRVSFKDMIYSLNIKMV